MKELKITKGEWIIEGSDPTMIVSRKEGETIPVYIAECRTIDFANKDIEQRANAQLIAEAGTVANECGKTPRELLEERNKLREALYYLYHACPNDGTWNHPAALNMAWNVLEETK